MDTYLTVAYSSQIATAATRHHLDPRLLAAVAAQETGGPGADSGRNIVGDAGHGHGIFQIDDRWHAFARTPQAMDPSSNADYAAGMLESNLNRYGGDVRSALSAYNTGSPNATGTRTDWGDGAPVGYADSVFRHYARLGGDPAAATASSPAAGSATDPTSSSSLGQLQALASQLGGASGLAMPLNLPPYRPLPQLDGRDRDLAPSADGLGEGDDSMGA
jgi:hypothetical protein